MRDLFKTQRHLITQVHTAEIAALQAKAQQYELECQQMDRDLRQFADQIDLEKERQSANRKKIKKVKKQLGGEVAALKDEVQGQQEKKERIEVEKAENADTIEQLKENFDDLNEQILRIDLKISQAVNEKLRLE